MLNGLEEILKADSAKSTKIDCTQSVEEYINKHDWRIFANANTGYSNAGLVNNLAGKVIANFWLDKVYSKKEGDAHRNGDYHIHDLDCLSGYCCGHDLQRLLNEGFNGVVGRVGSKPPKHLREALYQMANFIGILQAEWGGAQAFSSFDTYLAPYVFFDTHYSKLNYTDVKKAILNFIYNLNVPSRWGQCVPNTYKCLKGDGTWVNYKDLKVGDEIYVANMKTGMLQKDTVTHVNHFQAPEVLHKYTSNTSDFNFLVTPNHKVIVENNDKFSLKDSSSLLKENKDVTIPAARWTPIYPEEYMKDEYNITDELLKLLAYIITGEYIDTENNIVKIKLSDNLSDGFEELCNELEIKYSKSNECYLLPNDLLTDLVDLKSNKLLISDKLSPGQANTFINTLCIIKGFYTKCHYEITFDNKHMQEMLAYLGIIAGRTINVRHDEDTNNFIVQVNIGQSYQCNIEEVECAYDEVWCPTTNSGTFICMSDEGYIFLTGNSPFSNITIDWTVPDDMKEQYPLSNDKNYFDVILDGLAEKGFSQEKLENLVNTAKARLKIEDNKEISLESGKEILSQLSYKHFQKEMNIINKAFYECLNDGDIKGIPFTFPIPTVNITENFNWDGENVDLLFENAAKYGSSYFQNFIGSQYKRDEDGNLMLDPNAYTPSDVRSMCPLTGDTEVIVANHFKGVIKVPISELDEKQHKVYSDGHWCQFKRVEITHQKVYKVTLSNNVVVKMGEHHLQPTSEGTKECKDLKVGDLIPFSSRVISWNKIDKPQEFEYYNTLVFECNHTFYAQPDEKIYVDIKDIVGVSPAKLYCIEVDNSDHTFVLGNGMITHNCRLQLDKRELRKRGGGLFGSDAQTGSIGVVTINMARLGYLYKNDLKGLYKRLSQLLELAKSTLEKKRIFIKEMFLRGLYPYTKRYLRGFDTFFSTIGVNGMNEMIRNFTDDKEDITTEFGHDVCYEILQFIRTKMADFQEETGNLYNLEATPAEGTTYRFAKEDIKRYSTKEIRYIICEKHGKVEIEDNIEDELIECPLCKLENK